MSRIIYKIFNFYAKKEKNKEVFRSYRQSWFYSFVGVRAYQREELIHFLNFVKIKPNLISNVIPGTI
jgi:hypothetical protein